MHATSLLPELCPHCGNECTWEVGGTPCCLRSAGEQSVAIAFDGADARDLRDAQRVFEVLLAKVKAKIGAK